MFFLHHFLVEKHQFAAKRRIFFPPFFPPFAAKRRNSAKMGFPHFFHFFPPLFSPRSGENFYTLFPLFRFFLHTFSTISSIFTHCFHYFALLHTVSTISIIFTHFRREAAIFLNIFFLHRGGGGTFLTPFAPPIFGNPLKTTGKFVQNMCIATNNRTLFNTLSHFRREAAENFYTLF